MPMLFKKLALRTSQNIFGHSFKLQTCTASRIGDQATIWRWREDFQHDFAARMDWCIADSRDQANHNPHVVVSSDQSKRVLHRDVKPGETLQLSASGTSDPIAHRISTPEQHSA